MKEVIKILDKIPGTAEMLSIPGVGITTVAGFLAEVGDLSKLRSWTTDYTVSGLESQRKQFR